MKPICNAQRVNFNSFGAGKSGHNDGPINKVVVRRGSTVFRLGQDQSQSLGVPM